jgi:hypothetical protein
MEVPTGEGGRSLSGPARPAPRHPLRRADRAGERLAATSSRAWRGEVELARVQEGAAEVLALDALLRELET